jgi:hypothetical protein
MPAENSRSEAYAWAQDRGISCACPVPGHAVSHIYFFFVRCVTMSAVFYAAGAMLSASSLQV